MARKKLTDLTTPTARLDCEPRSKPHKAKLGRGVTLGYRRPQKGPGSWLVIASTGNGKQEERVFASADDASAPAGALSYAQAVTKCLELAQAHAPALAGAIAALPITIEQAIAAYKLDLQSRRGNVTNATQILHHIPATHPLRPTLLAQVTPAQLNDWRLALTRNNMKPATQKRLFKSVHAAFNLAARMDDRIAANAKAWVTGLPAPKEADRARNAVHELPDIRALVAAAYAISPAFGLYVQAHAELGARTDQIARIRIAHLRGDRVAVPNSGKGRGKSKETSGVTWRALTPTLATHLANAAGNRPRSSTLLVDETGNPWSNDRARRLFARAVAATDVLPVDEDAVTFLTFRHSSIVQRILAGVPLKVVATMHNTSTAKIESNYAAFLPTDDFDRSTLVDTSPATIIPLPAAAAAAAA
jgi:hypothetical protein